MEFIIVFIIIILAICFRVFIISQWDRDRIIYDARIKGWVISDIVWEPFGPGWFGEKNDRIYLVQFIDENGRHASKYCKTSMLSGVYWK